MITHKFLPKLLRLKTGMDFRILVWKRVYKIKFFGQKSGQDLKNRAAHTHQEFPGVHSPPPPPRVLTGLPKAIFPTRGGAVHTQATT